jgi:hypothetical protein
MQWRDDRLRQVSRAPARQRQQPSHTHHILTRATNTGTTPSPFFAHVLTIRNTIAVDRISETGPAECGCATRRRTGTSWHQAQRFEHIGFADDGQRVAVEDRYRRADLRSPDNAGQFTVAQRRYVTDLDRADFLGARGRPPTAGDVLSET